MKASKSIYYLDDDQDDLYIFQEVAESLGHKVNTFINGHELLSALSNPLKKPDVIFLDIHMPILKGEEILIILKNAEDWKDIPVVMISGAYPKKLIRYFAEVGANYLMKRPVVTDFKKALEEVMKIDLTRLPVAP